MSHTGAATAVEGLAVKNETTQNNAPKDAVTMAEPLGGENQGDDGAPSAPNDAASQGIKGPALICANCRSPAGRLCSYCHDTWYCSKKCRAKDNKVHTLVCAGYTVMRGRHRPSHNHRLALVFYDGVGGDGRPRTPLFEWRDEATVSNFRRHASGSTYSYSRLDQIQHLNGVNFGYSATKNIHTQNVRFYRCGNPYDTQLLPNYFLWSLGSPGLSYPWVGPIVAMGCDGDLNTRDFRAIIDFFQLHYWNAGVMDRHRYGGQLYRAVKLNGDRDFEASNKYIQEVQLTEEMWSNRNHQTLGLLRGVQDLTYYRVEGYSVRNMHGMLFQINECARLDRSFSPYLIEYWQKTEYPNLGTVVIMDRHAKHFTPQQFKDIEQFAINMAAAIIGSSHGLLATSLLMERLVVHEFAHWGASKRREIGERAKVYNLANPARQCKDKGKKKAKKNKVSQRRALPGAPHPASRLSLPQGSNAVMVRQQDDTLEK